MTAPLSLSTVPSPQIWEIPEFMGSGVKIGEDKSVLLLLKNNFFSVSNPEKIFTIFTRSGLVAFSTRHIGQKTVIFADRHAESEAK